MPACVLLLLVPGPSAATPREPPRPAAVEVAGAGFVSVDVVVRDQKERPVPGLGRDDFELVVDDRGVDRSTIGTFEEVCPQAPAVSAPDRDRGRASAAGEAAGTRRIVLYFDFSQLTLSGRQQALKAARDFLARRLRPEDRAMIVTHKTEVRLVREFTSDAPSLISRIDELLDDASTIDTDVLEETHNLSQLAGRSAGRREVATPLALQEEARARRSLTALRVLMPSLAGAKGRKALVLFTDVLRAEPGVQYLSLAGMTPEGAGINVAGDLLRVTTEANAAGVSIYTAHAGGQEDAAAVGQRGAGSAEEAEAAAAGLASTLSLQTALAAETGGQALLRTNDPAAALAAAQRDLSCYYLIGYRRPGGGDGRRHHLRVRLRPDASGDPRRDLVVRSRPHFTDESPRIRREWLLRSALEAPDLYRAVGVTTEAFALAPEKRGRRILIKATVPLDSVTLASAQDGSLGGAAVIRGRVSAGEETACVFKHDLDLVLKGEGRKTRRLVYLTGCVLPPGRHVLALAVLDRATLAVGAHTAVVNVPPAGAAKDPYVGDVQLWARDPEALVVILDAAKIGLREGSGGPDMIPRAERRIRQNQEGMLTYVLCPPSGSAEGVRRPIRIRQALADDLAKEVMKLRDLSITDPPSPDTGCYQISNVLQTAGLQTGIYTFTVEVEGPAFPSRLTRRSALAVQ